MGDPVIIAVLTLAGVSAAGLHIDTRALKRHQTQAFGRSALAAKALLLVAVVGEGARVQGMPSVLSTQLGQRSILMTILAVGVPLVVVALGCEIAAYVRFRQPPPQTHHVTDLEFDARNDES